jgi:hypothetical protein
MQLRIAALRFVALGFVVLILVALAWGLYGEIEAVSIVSAIRWFKTAAEIS